MRSLELSILDILTEDARTPVSQMSVMLGVSQTEIAETIARLEKQRIIIKYPALIHWEKVETEQVEALIEVRITPMRDRGFDAVAEQIYRFDEVSSVFLMSGGYDLTVILTGRTLREVALFVSQKLSTIEGVTSTATHFILKKYKQSNVVFIPKEEQKERLIFV